MNLADIQATVIRQLAIARTVEIESLIEALIPSVIADIMMELELDTEAALDSAFATVAGQDFSVAPVGFVKPIKIWRGSEKPLNRLQSAEEYFALRSTSTTQEEPKNYYVMGRNTSGRRLIYWQPVPAAIHTYNLAHYLIGQGLTLANVPDEWDLTIVAGIKKYLVELKSETLVAYTGAETEYRAKLNKLLALERRPGEKGLKVGVDPALTLKQGYILRQGRGKGFNNPWD